MFCFVFVNLLVGTRAHTHTHTHTLTHSLTLTFSFCLLLEAGWRQLEVLGVRDREKVGLKSLYAPVHEKFTQCV